jgi:hypothetical protein
MMIAIRSVGGCNDVPEPQIHTIKPLQQVATSGERITAVEIAAKFGGSLASLEKV